MNDSDTRFMSKLTDKPGNACVLIPEANVQIVDNGTTHTKELGRQKEEKSRKKHPNHLDI